MNSETPRTVLLREELAAIPKSGTFALSRNPIEVALDRFEELERENADLREQLAADQHSTDPQNPCSCIPDGDDGTVAHLCEWHKAQFGNAYRMQNMADSLTVENIAKLPEDKLRLWIAHGIQESSARKRAEERLAAERGRVAEAQAEKDEAYLQRNYLVAALARIYPSGVKNTDSPGWPDDCRGCCFIDLPSGQISYHFRDSHRHLFDSLPPYKTPWDGHSKETVHDRLRTIRALADPQQSAPNNPQWPKDHERCPKCRASFLLCKPESSDAPCPFCGQHPQRSEQQNAEGQAPCYSEVKPEVIEVGTASSDRLNSVPPTPAVNKRTGEDLGQDDHRVPAQPDPSAPDRTVNAAIAALTAPAPAGVVVVPMEDVESVLLAHMQLTATRAKGAK